MRTRFLTLIAAVGLGAALAAIRFGRGSLDAADL